MTRLKRVLITGANSYVGTNVEKWLMKEPDKYYVETIDMKDPNWKNFDFSKFDVVFHVAGIVHVRETQKNRKLYYLINRDLAIEVSNIAKNSHVKHFILMSSMSVYGIYSGAITKDSYAQPKSHYGKSKLEAEEAILKMKSNEFIVTILRPSVIYGFNSPGNFSKLIKIAKIMPIFPLVYNNRSMLYIDNFCLSLLKVIDRSMDGVIIIQNSYVMCTSSLVSQIRKVLNKKTYESRVMGFFIKNLLFFRFFKKVFGSLYYSCDTNNLVIENEVAFNDSIVLTVRGH